MKAKRDVFSERMEGIDAMKGQREGKLTLRSYKVEVMPLPKSFETASRYAKEAALFAGSFARKLRINERTLEKWEQGRAKPNPQAAALVLLGAGTRIRWSGWTRWQRVSASASILAGSTAHAAPRSNVRTPIGAWGNIWRVWGASTTWDRPLDDSTCSA